MLRRARSFLRTLLFRRRFREELEEEMSFHVEELTEDLIRTGLDPLEARRQARLRFGSPERVRAESEAVRGVGRTDEVVRNVRFALRGLVRSPLLSLTFILTLALSLGVGTAVFSVVDGVLWRPLPYPDADRLAVAVQYDPELGKSPDMAAIDGTTWFMIRDGLEEFQPAVYSGGVRGVNLSTPNRSAFVRQQRVGAGFFATLGVPPWMGREFDAAEDLPDGPATTVISHGLWTNTFTADPEILGTAILLKGEPHTVVGVMPADFYSEGEADLWTPLRASTTGEGGGANYLALLRIPAGMSWDAADARAGSNRFVGSNAGTGEADLRLGLLPVNDATTTNVRVPLLVILGAIVAMMFVGWANLAGIQVARALARRPEFATRMALGGGTGALLRQTVTENLVLGALGGLSGLGVAYLTTQLLQSLLRATFSTWPSVMLDGRVLLAAGLFTLAATAFFGLAPLIQILRADMQGVLTSGSQRVTGGGAHRWRKMLLIGEVAMVTTLLFAAGLLVRSYGHLASLDPGFDPSEVTTVQLSLEDARYSDATQVTRLFDESLDAIRRVPGVQSAAVALTLPYERPLNLGARVAGSEEGSITNAVYVTPDFFETLGIPLLQGRYLTDADRAGNSTVVVANQAFVDMRLRGLDPLGTRIDMGFGGGQELEIVGVVGNVQQRGGGWGPTQPVWASPTVYIPSGQASSGFFSGVHIWFSPSWLVKAAPGRSVHPNDIVQAINVADPDLPIARVETLIGLTKKALALPRFQAAFLTVVALLSLLMAAIGVYGIVAHEVLERRREMGLRMALGATPGGAVWAAGSTGLRLGFYGLLVGAVFAFGAGRVVRRFIWGVPPYDPVTLLALVGIVSLLVAISSFLPASRVGRMDPASILKDT